jgi:hypothetical protein
MKQYLFTVALFFAIVNLSAQTLVSARLLGTRTAAQIQSQFSLPFTPPYNVRYYYITYTSPDLRGVRDTLSGLLALPNDTTRTFPRLVYQHGTSDSKRDVPSINPITGEGAVGLVFASFGYVSALPDYLGLGVSKGLHPYIHAESEASVAVDMLRATRQYAANNGARTNNQIFITGYSQGGHAAMALQQMMETRLTAEFAVTASAPLSGPYSIGTIMRGLMLDNTREYNFVAYLPNTALSFQAAYGNLYKKLEDIFKPAYVPAIEQFANGQITLSTLNRTLIQLLIANTGKSIPRGMFQDSVVQNALSNPRHPVNVALSANDTYRFTARAPTRLFYCTADDQVPFQNSVLARDSMVARRATNLQATDVGPTLTHGPCFQPAILNTLLFFGNFQRIDMNTSAAEANLLPISVGANLVSDRVLLADVPGNSTVTVFSLDGQLVYRQRTDLGGSLDIATSNWKSGTYVARVVSGGKAGMVKFMVMH